jgi:hypothetical protein
MIEFKAFSDYKAKEGDVILGKFSETSYNVLYVKSGYYQNQLSLVGYDGNLYLQPQEYAMIKPATNY